MTHCGCASCAMACGGTGRKYGVWRGRPASACIGLHRGGLGTVERSVLSPVPSHSACEERWLKLLAAKKSEEPACAVAVAVRSCGSGRSGHLFLTLFAVFAVFSLSRALLQAPLKAAAIDVRCHSCTAPDVDAPAAGGLLVPRTNTLLSSLPTIITLRLH